MAEEGLRRSTRVRKAVQSYAVAQAEEADELVLRAPPLKRKKKNANIDDFDVQLTAPDVSSDAEVTKVVKKRTKKVTATKETTFETVPSQPSKKRKKTTTDTSWHAEAAENRIIRTKQQTKKLAPGKQEKRLRDYVDVPSDKYHRFVESANTQLGIFRKKGQEINCKHVLYVLHHVLKAPDELKYQNAFLASELRQIFTNAPSLPTEVADDEPKDGNRKPVEDDCPICCMEFEADEEVVWCRAACGNNVHKSCFDQWAKTKPGSVTCPFCRTPWQIPEASKKQKVGVANIEIPTERGGSGYRNVRHLLEYE